MASGISRHDYARKIIVQCQCGEVLDVEAVMSEDYNFSVRVAVEPHYCKPIPKPKAPSIDTLVKENREVLEALHMKFLKWDDVERHYMCECPICRSLELGGDCQE